MGHQGGGGKESYSYGREDMRGGVGSKQFHIQNSIHVISLYNMYHTAGSFSLSRTRSFGEFEVLYKTSAFVQTF